jgi:hypothetical protein
VGFEPTIAVLEGAKTVRALDRSATAIDSGDVNKKKVKGKKYIRRRQRKYEEEE